MKISDMLAGRVPEKSDISLLGEWRSLRLHSHDLDSISANETPSSKKHRVPVLKLSQESTSLLDFPLAKCTYVRERRDVAFLSSAAHSLVYSGTKPTP